MHARMRMLRRHPLLVALAVALLAGIIALAWFHFRPAMGIEQQLVGTWRVSYAGENAPFPAWSTTLTSGRRQIFDGQPLGGKWYVQGATVHFTDPWYEEAARTLLGTSFDNALDLSFPEEGVIMMHSQLNDGEFRWERVPD